MNHYASSNTKAYYTMSWISFVLAFTGGLIGIWYLEGSLPVKAFLIMTFLFMVSSCFSLAKAVRDKHEENQVVNRVEKAKTEKLLNEYVDKG